MGGLMLLKAAKLSALLILTIMTIVGGRANAFYPDFDTNFFENVDTVFIISQIEPHGSINDTSVFPLSELQVNRLVADHLKASLSEGPLRVFGHEWSTRGVVKNKDYNKTIRLYVFISWKDIDEDGKADIAAIGVKYKKFKNQGNDKYPGGFASNVLGDAIPVPFTVGNGSEKFAQNLTSALDEATHWFKAWMQCKDMDKDSMEFKKCFPYGSNFIIPEAIAN